MWRIDECLEDVGESGESAFDGAIQHVIADLDAQSAEKLGGNFVFKSEITAILLDNAVGGASAFFEVERCGAFDDRMFALRLEAHQALQGDQNALIVARFLRNQFLDRAAQMALVERTAGGAHPENAMGVGPGDFGDFHAEVKKRISIRLERG